MRKRTTICLTLVSLFLLSTTVNSSIITNLDNPDLDPLVDLTVTFEPQTIRFFEGDTSHTSRAYIRNMPQVLTKRISQILIGKIFNKRTVEILNVNDDPSMYLKVFINDVEFVSDVWSDTRYVYDPQWSATLNVPDDQEFVNIKIQLLDSEHGDNMLYDISRDPGTSEDGYDVELVYSLKTGHWTGDDELHDSSGYGRLCGTDDGTIYQKDRDCEIWFNIYQNDYDNDGIPYWTEVNDYGSDPQEKNTGDPDEDGIPVEWEWKWGYDPFEEEDHKQIDPEEDSISNLEEYLTAEWFSDPYRKDVFVEMDIMEEGPNGEKSYFPENSKELIQTAFDRQNIVFHLDMGDMGGYEIIPFEDNVGYRELREIYEDYFLHGDINNWRRGVFHYGVVVYTSETAAGYMFRANAFQISTSGHEKLSGQPGYERDIVYASAYMHELGHTFGFSPIPGHTREGGILLYMYNQAYISCMNYGWMYVFVDYSDGSRRAPDLNDWDPDRMHFDYFERER